MQIESRILYFFLLVLIIPLNLSLNINDKQCRFFKTLLEKNFELFPSSRNGTITFHVSYMLLPAKVDLILEKQGCKKNLFGAYSINYIKKILAFSTEVVIFYMWVLIVEVKVSGFTEIIAEYGVNCIWPYFWPQKNDFRANLMAVCKFTFVHILGGPRKRVKVWVKVAVWAKVEVWSWEVVGKSVEVLPLVEAPPTSLSLPAKRGLQQLYRPVLWLAT